MKKSYKGLTTAIIIIVALLIAIGSCTKMVDNSEIGIKFKKFSLTEQGELVSTQVSGLTFYNPITTKIFTYPVYIQQRGPQRSAAVAFAFISYGVSVHLVLHL